MKQLTNLNPCDTVSAGHASFPTAAHLFSIAARRSGTSPKEYLILYNDAVVMRKGCRCRSFRFSPRARKPNLKSTDQRGNEKSRQQSPFLAQEAGKTIRAAKCRE